jgi:transcriptional regulator with XRE-family HTH domain
MPNLNPWSRLAELVDKQMTDQGMSQADLERKSGVSDFTIRKVLKGDQHNYRGPILRKLSLALGWTADSAERILNLGEPVLNTTPARLEELEQQLSNPPPRWITSGVWDQIGANTANQIALVQQLEDQAERLAELAARVSQLDGLPDAVEELRQAVRELSTVVSKRKGGAKKPPPEADPGAAAL